MMVIKTLEPDNVFKVTYNMVIDTKTEYSTNKVILTKKYVFTVFLTFNI